MIFEISTFKLAKISSKILDTKKKIFFFRAVYYNPTVPFNYYESLLRSLSKNQIFL